MKSNRLKLPFIFLSLAGISFGASAAGTSRSALDTEMIDRGRYIAKIAGCNDCHTPGYLTSDGNVPEERWLSGDTFGWRGPWGTTYGPNLRLFISTMSEDEWVTTAKTLKRLPPMPWFNLNAMKEHDLRALYQFMRSLGEPGEPAPAYLPPDQKPNPPYALFPSPPE
jgi:mono/diheme cytochrome c family protein